MNDTDNPEQNKQEQPVESPEPDSAQTLAPVQSSHPPLVGKGAAPMSSVEPSADHSTEPSSHDDEGPALSGAQWNRMNRRELLKLAPVALAGAFLVPALQKPLLRSGLRLSDWASGEIFSSTRLAPTFAASHVDPFEKFPYNGYDVLDPEVDLDEWTLTVEGNVQRPGEYKLEQIKALPKITQNVRHVCVEGWDVIGSFGGTRISDFLRSVGADTKSRFVELECADDYYESIDMASALHPQSLLCYEMYGQPLNRKHGAPLRLNMPTKLGYKQAKYITTLRVTNVFNPKQRGYWEDQGYSWFAGM